MKQENQDISVEAFEAFICFIDIINSVSYSRIMDNKQYMSRILMFEMTIKKYFKFFFNDDEGIIKINRGDEFLIIIKNPDPFYQNSIRFKIETLEKLIFFINITKYILEKFDKIEIASGIHYGEVLSCDDGTDSIFTNVDNYTCKNTKRYYGNHINYAKRVETSSRDGAYLKIMMSYSCADIIKYIPLVYDTLFIEMKGYSNKELIYELVSGYVYHYMKEADDFINELYNDRIFEYIDSIDNKLLKYSLLGLKINPEQNPFFDHSFIDIFKKIIWDNPYTDDPIKLYFRGNDCFYSEEYVLAFDYYFKVHKILPYYTNIYQYMIRALHNILKENKYDKTIDISSILYIKLLSEDCIKNFSDLFAKEKSQFESFRKNAEEFIKKNIR